MKKNVFILTFLLANYVSLGQRGVIDSLINEFANSKNDTLRLQQAGNLADVYTEIKPDSALYYAEEELELARKLKFRLNEAYALQQMGYDLMNMGNYPKSLEMLLSAITIVEDPGSEKNILPDQFVYGEDLFSPAMSPHLKRLDRLARMNQYVGILYGNALNYEKEKNYYLQARELAGKTGNVLLSSYCNGTLARAYLLLKMNDSALITIQKAYDQSTQVGYRKYQGSILLNFGRIHAAMNNKDLAIEYYRKALETSRDFGYLRGVVASNLALGDDYLHKAAMDSALYFIHQGLDMAKQLNAPSLLLRSYTSLANYFRLSHNNDSLVKYQDLIIEINEGLFSAKQAQLFQTIDFDEQQRQQQKEAEDRAYLNRLKMYGLIIGLAVLLIIAIILYRNNQHRQKAYLLLERQKKETDVQRVKAEQTLVELKSAQAQLIQSEKMASLGELTAGIAHEIENPLNFVNNFSEINEELVKDMRQALEAGNIQEALSVSGDIENNMARITEHGKRADDIVKSMLQHSSSASGQKELTDVNALCEEYLKLSYHGIRARGKNLVPGEAGFSTVTETQFDPQLSKMNLIPQDLGRVLMNIYNNAFYAVNEKRKKAGPGYEPKISISTKAEGNKLKIVIRDNGTGIPEKLKEKIFQPFFTTKPAGQGTGLGLSLSYDIVRAMGGEIKVESKEGEWTEFTIMLN